MGLGLRLYDLSVAVRVRVSATTSSSAIVVRRCDQYCHDWASMAGESTSPSGLRPEVSAEALAALSSEVN